MGGTGNGIQNDSETEERNRPVGNGADQGKNVHVWTSIDLGGQNLRCVAKNLFNYAFLTRLYLNCNKLRTIPSAIGGLRSLTHLDVSLNELREIPPEIGMLVQLKQFLLFDNQVETLPVEMGSLYQLEMLGVEGNPITENWKSILMEQGTAELIKHFRENAPGTYNPRLIPSQDANSCSSSPST